MGPSIAYCDGGNPAVSCSPMKARFILLAFLATAPVLLVMAQDRGTAVEAPATVLDLSATDIHGNEVALSRYRGKVLLIVNTASKCGFTYQFGGLQALWERYRDRGFVVLGFPSDNFAGQEYESDEAILAFCTGEYDVTFPMFSRIDVRGDTAHPIYRFLTDPNRTGRFGGPITWNFNKFLIDRDGHVVARFDTPVEPEDPAVVAAIEAALE